MTTFYIWLGIALILAIAITMHLKRKHKEESSSSEDCEEEDRKKDKDKDKDKDKNKDKEEDKKPKGVQHSPSYYFLKVIDYTVLAVVALVFISLLISFHGCVRKGIEYVNSQPWFAGNWSLRVYDGDKLTASQITVEFYELSENGVVFTSKFMDNGRRAVCEYEWRPKQEAWGHWKTVQGSSNQNGRFRVRIPILRQEATAERTKVFHQHNIPYVIVDSYRQLYKLDGLIFGKDRVGFKPENERLKMVFYR